MKRKPFWHKIPKEDQEMILEFSKLTYGQFMKKYRQPEWCGYPDALEGMMGCWSLLIPGRVTNRSFCIDCELNRIGEI